MSNCVMASLHSEELESPVCVTFSFQKLCKNIKHIIVSIVYLECFDV